MTIEKGSWRNTLLTANKYRHDNYTDSQKEYRQFSDPLWVRRGDYEYMWEAWREDGHRYNGHGHTLREWPMYVSTVLGMHTYTGPYLTNIVDGCSVDSGEIHGTESPGCHGYLEPDVVACISNEALAAIERSDIVFAFINTRDCFGTLVEIGYAKALGKHVHVVLDPICLRRNRIKDFDFVLSICDGKSYRAEEFCCPPGKREHIKQHEWFCREIESEERIIRDALKDCIVAYAAKAPQHPKRVSMHDTNNNLTSTLRQIRDSFAIISEWTSDPRVRGEAMRMLKTLNKAV